MDSAWIEIFRGIGISIGQGLFLLVIGYTLKSIYDNKLQQNLEKYKNELQSESDKKFEQYRNDLENLKLENQIRFSGLHEDRRKIIATLYIQLREFGTLVVELTHPLKRGETIEEVENADFLNYRNAKESFDKLYNNYNNSRIYFTPKTCEIMDKLISELTESVTLYTEKMNTLDYSKSMLAWKKVNNEIPAALAQVEKEFREMLGIQS